MELFNKPSWHLIIFKKVFILAASEILLVSGKRNSEKFQNLRKDTAVISRHGQSNGIINPKFIIRNSNRIGEQKRGVF